MEIFMKRILLYFSGDKEPRLVIHSDGHMDGSQEVVNNEECREMLLKRYRSLGKTFDEAYNAVVSHNNNEKTRKQPFFWDEPLIQVDIRE